MIKQKQRKFDERKYEEKWVNFVKMQKNMLHTP